MISGSRNTTGLHVDDGAVFWMDPNAAPGGKVTVAQLTVPTGASWLVSLNAQGRSRQPSDSDDRVPDWAATALFFQHNGTGPIGEDRTAIFLSFLDTLLSSSTPRAYR